MAACDSDEWSDWDLVEWDINTNCRELVDNLADMAHFEPLHGAPVDYFCNVFDGPHAFQMYQGTSPRHAENATLAKAYSEMTHGSFDDDVRIWARKTRVDNPLLCAADGPIMQLREWYHQFYTNVADLHESRRHRSIFEFDVEKRIWHAVPEQAKTRLFDL